MFHLSNVPPGNGGQAKTSPPPASTNPTPTAAPGLAVVDGQVYLIGGCSNSSCAKSNVVVRHDPGADTFTTLAPYPQ